MALNNHRRLMTLWAGLFLLGHVAAAAADQSASAPPQSEKPVYADQPQCRSWTDECINCSRGEDGGAPICSNIGAACQPKVVRCVQTEPPPAAPTTDDKTNDKTKTNK